MEIQGVIEPEYIIVQKIEDIEDNSNSGNMELNQGIHIIHNEHDMEEEEEEEEIEIPQGTQKMQTVYAKVFEEKTTITYRKLVVPQSMRSIYWKFFGFPADDDGEILTRAKIVCLLCKTQIAYNRNTSNLRMHLQNKHSQELQELEAYSPPRKSGNTSESKEKRTQRRLLKAAMATSSQHIYTTDIGGTVQIGNNIELVTDPNISFPEHTIENSISTMNVMKPLKYLLKTEPADNQPTSSYVMTDNKQHQIAPSRKSIKHAILEMLIIDLHIPDIVTGEGFQNLINILRLPYKFIPDKHVLEHNYIPNTYQIHKDSLVSTISSLDTDISLAVEEWNSNFGCTYFSFLIYYQSQSEAVLKSKMLCTVEGPKIWDEQQWDLTLDWIFKIWCINIEKIATVVTSTSREELLNAMALKGLTVVPCLLYSLQVCAQACFNDDEVQRVLDKCRNIVGVININSIDTAKFAGQDQCVGLEENSLTKDHPFNWISTYSMLQSILQRRQYLSDILSNIENINFHETDLNEEEWQIISDLVEVLKPFEVTIITISEEKMPLISLLKPLLWQLVSAHLKAKEEDTDTASAFKESLSQMLCARYEGVAVNSLLQIATNLDPRFKEVPYATDEDKKKIKMPIKEMLIKLIEETEDEQPEVKTEEEPVAKKSRMHFLLGGIKPKTRGMPADDRADLELAQYQSEPTASLDSCPLQWWSKISAKCPNLSNVASRYHCVPVCCPPPSRIPIEAQLAYHTKRAALSPHLVDKLLFLHANYNLD